MTLIDLVIKSINDFYSDLKKDENGRYRSWEHCYKVFFDARQIDNPNYDYLSLHLAFYLASWGMYRGSSFLLQKDYKIHVPVIKELLKPEYNGLLDMKCCTLKEENIQEKLDDLNKFIKNHYDKIRDSVSNEKIKSEISDTLVTKILMGTLGCVPAYDRYFIIGVKEKAVSTGNYNRSSLLKLVDFYETNKKKFEEIRKKLKVDENLLYPQMKLVDMAFWKIGFDIDTEKRTKK